MSIRKFALVGIIILSLTSPAKAFKPGCEPDGFRGINWGTDISTLKDMEFVWTEPSGAIVYIKKGDPLKIGMANVVKIRYFFWKGKFFRVLVHTSGLENWRSLKEACFDKFGEAYRPNKYKEYYLWGSGKITGMAMGYDEITGRGHLIIDSREISGKVEIFEKKAEEKPKVVEGF